MYKQLEKLITLTNNDLNLVNRRFGQRVNVNIKMYINDCIRMYKIVC